MRPDGQIAWVIARLVPELDDGGRLKGILGTLTNITQHKQAEERQRDLEAQLQEAHKMESLGVLAAGVAHNVNNVLAIIMGTASLGVLPGAERGRTLGPGGLPENHPGMLAGQGCGEIHAPLRPAFTPGPGPVRIARAHHGGAHPPGEQHQERHQGLRVVCP